eukprot:CAMPEP_0175752038 /NCGR_PEP_ID=MMETSP0097-20121207/61547_1 /TAXON_ID=311494 /ORGANISM="Alexandrium monilatum, Strain CCMP3105" /LENGTH=49 /DNA_ID=CAMNT_0017060787 /DNA_START=13 /DNA_END=162 /DNA_ORIENTATION=-
MRGARFKSTLKARDGTSRLATLRSAAESAEWPSPRVFEQLANVAHCKTQ